MKKGYLKNSQTENSMESLPNERDRSPPRATHHHNIDSAHDKKIFKHAKRQDSLRASDPSHLKLATYAREMFLEIRQRLLEESPSSLLSIKKQLAIDSSDDAIMNSDPLQLLSYVKQIFDRTLDEKIDAERELAVKGENECNDYEAMLQKLEAEVRQHIRIEQQLKLYVESVQSKLEEQEKEGDISRADDIKKEYEGLHQENVDLSEKVKVCETNIRELKKKLGRKIEMIERLEKHVEHIPLLKKLVREMDHVLDGKTHNRSTNDSTLRGSQRSSKTGDEAGHSNSSYLHDARSRKGSHPAVGLGSQNYDVKSFEKDKHKESGDYIRIIDASTQFNEDGIKHKEPSKNDKVVKDSKSKQDVHPKLSARLGEKTEEEESHKKQRRPSKAEETKPASRDRHTDHDGHNINNIRDIKALLNAKIKEDIIEPSRFSCDGAFKMGVEEYLKKSFEKSESRVKKTKNDTSIKKNKAQFMENLREKAENLRIFSHKNSISKGSRPSTNNEKVVHHEKATHHEKVSHHEKSGHHPEQAAQSATENHCYDMYKVKETHGKKINNDRSQSVDLKKKILRQHKSRGSIQDDEADERHRKQVSFSGHSKVTVSSKVNQSGSGSGIFTKGHI